MNHKASGLHSHIRRLHPDFCKYDDVSIIEIESECPGDVPNILTSSPLISSFSAKITDKHNNEDVYKYIICFIKNNILYQVLDNEYFRGLLGLRVPFGLNGNTLCKAVIGLAQITEDAMFACINSNDVCLMIDGGTQIIRKLLHIII